MTIGNALNFIETGQTDRDLRRELVRAEGREALEQVLARYDLRFSAAEFEEAYSLSLFKCQEYGDAEALTAFRLWWKLLLRSTLQEEAQ